MLSQPYTNTKTFKKTHHKIARYLFVILSSAAALFAHLAANAEQQTNLSLSSMTTDVSYLASDKLRGRATFSKEIDQAANYIAQRFNEIGLSPLPTNQQRYLQNFYLLETQPEKITAKINQQIIDNKDITFISNQQSFSWQNIKAVQQSIIGENENPLEKLQKINQQGGEHLVIMHPKHQALFKRFSAFFQRPKQSLTNSKVNTLVLVLTKLAAIENLDITGNTITKKQALNNVVGVLPGQEKTDEFIIFSAHYDHLGVDHNKQENSQYDHSDFIYNGADDDASGTTAVIQLAQYYAERAKTHKNQRTLIFVAFTAEEIGGFGSQYFSQHIAAEKITAMINIEMIGKASKFGAGTLWMTGFEHSNLGILMNENLNVHKTKIYPDPYPQEQLFYRSDNATLARLGVPAHSFSSTQLDKDQYYHQVTDELATLNLPSMLTVIETIALGSAPLVDGSQTPTRLNSDKINKKSVFF